MSILNICYIRTTTDFRQQENLEILIPLLYNGDVSRTMGSRTRSLGLYICSRGRIDSCSCIVKKFGGLTARETIPTNLDGWNFTTYRRDWRLLSPPAPKFSYLRGRFYSTRIVIVDIGRISTPVPVTA